MSELLNITQVCARLGISRWTWKRWSQRGFDRQFLVARPMGQKRYSAERVDHYTAGKPMARIGKGAHVAVLLLALLPLLCGCGSPTSPSKGDGSHGRTTVQIHPLERSTPPVDVIQE